MRTIPLIAATLVFCIAAGDLEARDPEWGGLGAVAVSPDGKTIVVGGENRVLYVVAAADLTVKKRIWMSSRIGELCFSGDGTRLLLEDDDERLHFIDTKTWETVSSLRGKAWNVDCCASVDLAAGIAGSGSKSMVRFVSLMDGSEQGTAEVGGAIAAVGLDAEGKRVAVLLSGAKGEEPKVSYSEIPKDLTGLEKEEFKQRNDGRVSRLVVFEVPSGNLLWERSLWYTPEKRVDLALLGDAALVLGYGNLCAKIPHEGETTLFKLPISYQYGRGISADNRIVLAGGLRGGVRTNLETFDSVKIELEKLPGWPEYFARFAFHTDGTGYAVTSAFRLARIGADGKLETVVPIY